MSNERAEAAALRLLSGIEDGTMVAAQSADLAQETDAALLYLIFTWLRRKYEGHSNSDIVVGRLLAITNYAPTLGKKLKEGQADSLVEWFEDEYKYRDLLAREFVTLVVEKIES